jgi:uncharacterized protein (TIGR03437 family)
LSILGHEAGHRFLAFASVPDAFGGRATPMLSQDQAHWAFTFNSEASLLEGNRIRDNGPGTFPRFETIATVEGFSPLDQYLMGFRSPADVPATFYVGNPTVSSFRPAQVGVSFNGERRDVTAQALAAAEGRRTPDQTVSQRRFRFAFILITRGGQEPPAAALNQVETYRAAFEPYFSEITEQRATADTSLKKNVDLSLWPAGGVLQGAAAAATVELDEPAENDLTILLRSQTGAVGVPPSVIVEEGESSATFEITGIRQGVDVLSAEPADASYALTDAKVQVLGTAANLKLAVADGNAQRATPGEPLPEAIAIRVEDINKVPFAGVEVHAEVTPGGAVTPETAATDETGVARFTWTPGPGPTHELEASLASGAVVIATALDHPFVKPGGVVNAASYVPGLVKSSLGAIFGSSLAGGRTATGVFPYTTQLANVRVSVGGLPARLLYVSDQQINFLSPAGLGTGQAEIIVTSGAAAEAAAPVVAPVFNIQPGIFQDAQRQGAVLVYSGHIEIFCTGLGPVIQSPTSIFLQDTVARPIVRVNGQPAEVLFSGLAPGFIGLYQINVRRPAGLTGTVTLTVEADGAQSNQVTINLP